MRWPELKLNFDNLSTTTADKGFDWLLLRNKQCAEGVKPLIRYRVFNLDGIAENSLSDDRN